MGSENVLGGLALLLPWYQVAKIHLTPFMSDYLLSMPNLCKQIVFVRLKYSENFRRFYKKACINVVAAPNYKIDFQ